MSYTAQYENGAMTITGLAAQKGWALLEFGTNWCGHCMAAQSAVEEALRQHPDLTHIKEEDGKGRALGRHFRVKLWPTLVLLRDGQEHSRLVRPISASDVRFFLKDVR